MYENELRHFRVESRYTTSVIRIWFEKNLDSSLCFMTAENIVVLPCCCPRLHGHTWLGIATVYCSIFENNLMTLYMFFFFSCQLSGGGCREMQKLPSEESKLKMPPHPPSPIKRNTTQPGFVSVTRNCETSASEPLHFNT